LRHGLHQGLQSCLRPFNKEHARRRFTQNFCILQGTDSIHIPCRFCSLSSISQNKSAHQYHLITEGPFLRILAQSPVIRLPEAVPVPWHPSGTGHAAYSKYSYDWASKAFWLQSLSPLSPNFSRSLNKTSKCLTFKACPFIFSHYWISLNLSGFLKPLLSKISLSFRRQLRLCKMA